MIGGCGDRHLDRDMAGVIRDDRGRDFDNGTFDTKEAQHLVGSQFCFVRGGTGNDDVSCRFVGDIFCILTQHRKPEKLNACEDQQEENWQNESELHRLRAGSQRDLRRRLSSILGKDFHGVTP